MLRAGANGTAPARPVASRRYQYTHGGIPWRAATHRWSTLMELNPTELTPVINRLKRAQGQPPPSPACWKKAVTAKTLSWLAAVSKALDRAGFAIIATGLEQCIIQEDQTMDRKEAGEAVPLPRLTLDSRAAGQQGSRGRSPKQHFGLQIPVFRDRVQLTNRGSKGNSGDVRAPRGNHHAPLPLDAARTAAIPNRVARTLSNAVGAPPRWM